MQTIRCCNIYDSFKFKEDMVFRYHYTRIEGIDNSFFHTANRLETSAIYNSLHIIFRTILFIKKCNIYSIQSIHHLNHKKREHREKEEKMFFYQRRY